MKIGIFTGATSVRSKNIFTDISRYPTRKHKINSGNQKFPLIQLFSKNVFSSRSKSALCDKDINVLACHHHIIDTQPDKKDSVSFASGILARLVQLVGHVALRQLVHLDLSVFGEMKRRRAIQEQKEWIQTPASKKAKVCSLD